jgi:hypothetical protein
MGRHYAGRKEKGPEGPFLSFDVFREKLGARFDALGVKPERFVASASNGEF